MVLSRSSLACRPPRRTVDYQRREDQHMLHEGWARVAWIIMACQLIPIRDYTASRVTGRCWYHGLDSYLDLLVSVVGSFVRSQKLAASSGVTTWKGDRCRNPGVVDLRCVTPAKLTSRYTSEWKYMYWIKQQVWNFSSHPLLFGRHTSCSLVLEYTLNLLISYFFRDIWCQPKSIVVWNNWFRCTR